VASVKPATPALEKKPLGATPPPATEANLFTNANFENGLEGWEMVAFRKKGTMVIDTQELHEGNPTLRIDNVEPDHTFVRQMAGKPNTRYRLTGYIKTKKVEPEKKGAKDGACLLVGFTAGVQNGQTAPILKTQSWTKVSVDFTTTAAPEIRVGASLGSYNAPVSGTAWFSKMSLIELGPRKK
jgi:hypothetical protein